jgi:1,2-phenylacetyl-CoA epoxidase PaaB subunit
MAIGAIAISKIATGQQHRNETNRRMKAPSIWFVAAAEKRAVQPAANKKTAGRFLFANSTLTRRAVSNPAE